MWKRKIVVLLAWLPCACTVQTVGLSGETGPQGMTGSQGPPGETGSPGSAGVSPFSYVDENLMTDIYYSGGRVGIGTSSPSELLDVNGRIHLTGTIATDNWTTHVPWQRLGPPVVPSWPKGYWKLTTPIGVFEENAFSVRLKIFRYGIGGPPPQQGAPGGSTLEVLCSGYAFPGTGGLIKAECHADGSGDPVGIGNENDMVTITVGSGDYEYWYFDHATFDYVGNNPKSASDFQWMWVEDQAPPFPNHNRVVIDDVNGTIGIGTNKVSATLDVVGDAHVAGDVGVEGDVNMSSSKPTGTGLRLENTDTGGTAFQITSTGSMNQPGAGFLGIYDGPSGTYSMVIQGSSGNVGVGTTVPRATLDVNGTARLARYSAPPVLCDVDHNGTIALNHNTKMCVCNGTAWLFVSDDTTCMW